jgi:hypothetical protein
MSKEFQHLYKNYLGTTGNSAKVKSIHKFLFNYVNNNGWFDRDYNVQNEFLDYYPKWIESSQSCVVTGLDTFPYRFVSLGVTQTLDWFHLECARNNWKMRLFRGEYPYNRDVFDFDEFIDDESLKPGDAVIISVPFSANGDLHPCYNEIMKTCNKLNIPVMVDCAWFGTCYDLSWSLNYECIKVVAFSTTKGLQTGNWRSGICFSKWNHGSLAVQTEWNHGIHMNTYIGLMLMKEFSPDFVPNLYKQSQKEVCDYFNLIPSKTVHIATGDDQWNYFSRDTAYNRINLRFPLFDHLNGEFYRKIKI